MKILDTETRNRQTAGNQGEPNQNSWLWDSMKQYRFTRGEIKTLHLGLLTIIFSVVLFAILTNTMLLPAMKSSKLHTTECTTVHSEVSVVKPSSGCASSRNNECAHVTYYCLQIFVSFGYLTGGRELNGETSQEEGTTLSTASQNPFKRRAKQTRNPPAKSKQLHALLREDEMQGATLENVCSFRPRCNVDTAVSQTVTAALKKSLGRQGTRMTCYYDPYRPGYVILKRRYGFWTYFHCFFWPGLMMMTGCLIVFIILFCIARFKPMIGVTSKPSNIAYYQNTMSSVKRKTSTIGKRQSFQRSSKPQVKIGLTKLYM